MEKINIALPSDERYACGLIATAGSIALYASHKYILSFHILDGGITDSTFRHFEDLISRIHPHCVFHRHHVDVALFTDFPSWSGNKMAYARLMIPSFLESERLCIYSDTDVIWLVDIAELWLKLDERFSFQSVPETFSQTLQMEFKWFDSHGLQFDASSYVCTGVLSLNIQKIRSEGIVGRIGEFLKKHPDTVMADQTAINAVEQGKIGLLDSKWQRLTISRADGEALMGNVLHFAGEIPWRRGLWNQMITDTILEWHRINGKIHERSTWWSLRQYFSARSIIGRRFLWWVMRSPLMKSIMRAILYGTHRAHYFEEMGKWAKKGA